MSYINNEKIIYSNQQHFFDFNAMVLIGLSRYCNQLIFSEIFDIKFLPTQNYKYLFNKSEIIDLGSRKQSEIIFKKVINCDYNFDISIYNKNYAGKINININFINKGSFEKSYYLLSINIKNNKELKLHPFFLNNNGYKKLLSEFMHKIWSPILFELTKDKTKFCIKPLTNIETSLNDTMLAKLISVDKNQDLVFDVFHIVSSYINQNKTNNIYISADKIIQNRGLTKNANNKGCRSGYKLAQKEKIHASLNLLNSTNILNVNEIKPFNYLISENKALKASKPTILSTELISYNLKTQIWERRFAHYLCANKKEKIKIKTLIELIKEFSYTLKPIQLRDKVELILDNLCDNKIIKAWHYIKIDEDTLTGKYWLKKWLELYITCRY